MVRAGTALAYLVVNDTPLDATRVAEERSPVMKRWSNQHAVFSAKVMFLLASAVFATGTGACGDSDGDDTADGGTATPAGCPTAFTACGGDPVGLWRWTEWCVLDDAPEPLDGCPEALVSTSFDTDGTINIEAGGRFTVVGELQIVDTVAVPKSCAADCETLPTTLQINDDWACSDAGETCDCVLSQTLPLDQAGDWRLDGDAFVSLRDGETDERTLSYCIEDGRMLFRDRLSADNMDSVRPVFVFEK